MPKKEINPDPLAAGFSEATTKRDTDLAHYLYANAFNVSTDSHTERLTRISGSS